MEVTSDIWCKVAVICIAVIYMADSKCKWADDSEHSRVCLCDENPGMKIFCDSSAVYCDYRGACLNETAAAEYYPERFNRTEPCYYVDGWLAGDGLRYKNTCICNFTESGYVTRQFCGYMFNSCDSGGNCRTKTKPPTTTSTTIIPDT